jgi:hypothetical protein
VVVPKGDQQDEEMQIYPMEEKKVIAHETALASFSESNPTVANPRAYGFLQSASLPSYRKI